MPLQSPNSSGAGVPVSTEDIPFVAGSYTFVVVPDTQKYSDTAANHDEFNAMMDWVVASKNNRNIQLLLHEGDITDDNDTNDWTAAKNALSRLDGQVPYVLAQGNHDVSTGSQARSTLMNNYFALTDNALNGAGGINTVQYQAGEMQNTYSTLAVPGGRDFLIINLEYGPRQQVVDWANSIASDPQYEDHTAIFLTHAYMEEGPANIYGEPTPLRSNWDVFGSSRRYNPNGSGLSGDTNDGQQLWDDLVRKADNNIKLVFNGHYLDDSDSNTPENGRATTSLQVDRADDGEVVYQMVANWQQQANGGNGYMRLIEFQPDGKTIQVKTYSPTLDLWLTDPRNQFTIDLDAAAAQVAMPTDPVISITATGTVTGGDNYRGPMSLTSLSTEEGSFSSLIFPSSATIIGSSVEEFVGKDLGPLANEGTLTDDDLTTGVSGATQISVMFDSVLIDDNGIGVSNIFLFDVSPDELVEVMLAEALDINGNKIGVSVVLTDLWGDTGFDADSHYPAPGASPNFEENIVGLGIDINAFGVNSLAGIRLFLDGESDISGIAAVADILGDLDGDGSVGISDWPIFVINSLSDLSGLTPLEARLKGDLDQDLDNDLNDFLLFKKLYDLNNGPGAFNAMLAGVPEPSGFLLLAIGSLALASVRRKPKFH